MKTYEITFRDGNTTQVEGDTQFEACYANDIDVTEIAKMCEVKEATKLQAIPELDAYFL